MTGAGYSHISKLEEEIQCLDDVQIEYTHATGVISHIMEETQIAISSNGRTVYELAHMNIPAIVISQHKRESTHSFACEENGFVSVGLFEKGQTELEIEKQLLRLLDDELYRRQLFERTTKYRFNANKKKVIKRMLALLPS